MASPAAACKQALRDASAHWPGRSTLSDGIMGDARHQKTKSDHNVGNAFDITHDPSSGCLGSIIAAVAIDDPRTKYVIFNRKIFDKRRASPAWRAYGGQNPHTKHCHVSILASARDDGSAWGWHSPSGTPLPRSGDDPAPPRPVLDGGVFPGTSLQRGSRGAVVTRVQSRLVKLGWAMPVDGIFGDTTDRLVRGFQRRHDLDVDGIVGRKTWRALFT